MDFIQEEFKRKARPTPSTIAPPPTTIKKPVNDAARRLHAISDSSAPVVEQLKLVNARTLLVIGNEEAAGLAKGIREIWADQPTLQVSELAIDKANLTQTPPNWHQQLATLLAAEKAISQEKPLALVLMMGLHDVGALKNGDETIAPDDARWRDLYLQRLDALIEQVKKHHIPLFWVGRPPMRTKALNSHAALLNDLARQRLDVSIGRFIDTWRGFSGLDGKYSMTGPDTNGALRRLRKWDGEGFSPAGFRKLAFFVDREIRKEPQQETLAPAPLALAPSVSPATKEQPQTPNTPYIGAVVPLTSYQEADKLLGE